MNALSGTRLGPYVIDRLVGAGGTGDVYRARDTTLHRNVAIKILRQAVAVNPDRLERFSREAQVLASLNHPHIAQIHGLEDSSGIRALVMELVEGPTLADRIARGPIPLDEALPIARQIAEALEYAHEHGVVHRDLKPANIKIRKDGTVKVLDFGLATAVGHASGTRLGQTHATAVNPMTTEDDAIVGTPAYMSPDQARGCPADTRADLWAFGAVVYEMLTGRRAFDGEQVSDTLARVQAREPDWSALPAGTPPPIRRLLRRCLEKERRQRLDSAAGARLEIEEANASPAAESPVRAPARLPWIVVGSSATVVAAAILAVLVAWTREAAPATALAARFVIVPVAVQPLNVSSPSRDLAVSRDGRYVAYRFAGSNTAGSSLMIRGIDDLDGQPVPAVVRAYAPFFSPDGRSIAFYEDATLRKVSLDGGPPLTICRVSGALLGATWGDDNTIVFATSSSGTGLWRVSADGGEPTILTTPDPARREWGHAFPSTLPHGRGILFTLRTTGSADVSVAVLDLATGQRKTLIQGGSDAQYVETGHLVFAAAGALRAVRFDPVRLEVLGDPVPIAEHVMMKATGAANYAVSQAGTLAYIPSGVDVQAVPRSLVWVDRRGREQSLGAPLRAYGNPRLSPDGKRIVANLHDQNVDLWIWDIPHENLTRLTFDPAIDAMPVWTPDGQRIVYMSDRGGKLNLYRQAADGSGPVERLTESAFSQWPTSVTPGGTGVAGFDSEGAGTDLVLFSQASSGYWRSGALLQTPFNESMPEISPDGQAIAYQSNESGRDEVYVSSFPQVDRGRRQVSATGGTRPAWSRGGHELFYLDGSNALTAVAISRTRLALVVGASAKLFDTQYAEPNPSRHYDVSPDGQRFLMLKDNPGKPMAEPSGVVVVLNWFEELRPRVAAK